MVGLYYNCESKKEAGFSLVGPVWPIGSPNVQLVEIFDSGLELSFKVLEHYVQIKIGLQTNQIVYKQHETLAL